MMVHNSDRFCGKTNVNFKRYFGFLSPIIFYYVVFKLYCAAIS